MDYTLFIENIRNFGLAFFKEMDNTVGNALESDLKDIKIDKLHLVKEHQERKTDFDLKFALLMQKPIPTTNWQEIENMFHQIFLTK